MTLTPAEQVIEDQVYEYLISALQLLRKIAEVAADPAYLRKYPPSQLAILHNVMADKVARIIEVTQQAGTDYL